MIMHFARKIVAKRRISTLFKKMIVSDKFRYFLITGDTVTVLGDMTELPTEQLTYSAKNQLKTYQSDTAQASYTYCHFVGDLRRDYAD